MQQTTTRLTIWLYPWTLWTSSAILLCGGVLLAFALAALAQPLFGVWVLLMLALIGKVVLCEFDKTSRKITLKRWSVLGQQVIRYSFDDVVGVCVQTYKQKRQKNYRVSLVLSPGEFLPLRINPPADNLRAAQAIANQIRAFLHFKMAPLLDVFPAPSLKLAQLSFSKEQRESMIINYQKEIASHPGNLERHYWLIIALCLQGEKAKARASFEQSKALLLAAGDAIKAAQLHEAAQPWLR